MAGRSRGRCGAASAGGDQRRAHRAGCPRGVRLPARVNPGRREVRSRRRFRCLTRPPAIPEGSKALGQQTGSSRSALDPAGSARLGRAGRRRCHRRAALPRHRSRAPVERRATRAAAATGMAPRRRAVVATSLDQGSYELKGFVAGGQQALDDGIHESVDRVSPGQRYRDEAAFQQAAKVIRCP